MKKLSLLCAACLLVLAGCTGGNAETTKPVVTPTPTVTPLAASPAVTPTPQPAVEQTPVPVEPTPSPAVTETLLPTETLPSETDEPSPPWETDPSKLTLNDFPTQPISSGVDVSNAGIYLIAQLPEMDTWLYGVYTEAKDQRLILRVGTEWEAFDLSFLTPRGVLPRMYYGDFDQDTELELALVTDGGSGTGVSVETLHIVEFTDGWTALTFQSGDYEAILDQSLLCSYDAATHLATLQLGEERLDFDLTALGYTDPGGPVSSHSGSTVSFQVEGDDIAGFFDATLFAPSLPASGLPVAQVSAAVVYTGAAFGLSELTLSSHP